MSEEQNPTGPRYYGMRKYISQEGGYALWFASDWQSYPMTEGRQGTVYLPVAEDFSTYFSVEKVQLAYKVRQKDVPILRKGFTAGIESLPGYEIESQEESITSTLIMFETRFSFLEGETRRKRWVRNIYWGEGQLILIAHAATPELFEYWLPMFTNTMMTAQVM